ncbi:quinone oxidoreductase family protein [Sphingomonas aracearum]|uniref:quinone oxidoreductase family protein n=1 Tax=Sphingomonas aracearum TaxID=2283317 RepID=UPI0015F0A69F|nr:zinc-binding dehydrogenase [Sphingomonas aracearum]
MIVSTGYEIGLEVSEAEPLAPGAGQVSIDVRAIGVGRVDLIMRQMMPMAFVPGIEAAGIVSAVGPGADPQWLGRRVLARGQGGAYAEQIVVSSDVLVALPGALSFEAAVATGMNGLVAHFCLAKAQVAPGDRVVVRGARGGIGHLAVQMAKRLEADVVEPERNDAPSPADVVVDLVAGPDTAAYVEQLHANGRYVIAGIAAGLPPADLAGSLLADFKRSRSVATLSLDTIGNVDLNHAAQQMLAEVAAGTIRPLVAMVLPLEEADQAHRLLAKGGISGKILLVP